MSALERMDLDTARSQQKQVATAFHLLATILLGIAVISALHFASMRVRAQDENLETIALAQRILDQDASSGIPGYIQLASQQLSADGETGLTVGTRPFNDLFAETSALFDGISRRSSELDCLAEAVYYEARSELRVGQMAVAQVVLNRVDSRHWPNTICGVVYQGSERRTGCQFTFTCDGSLERAPYGRGWRNSVEVAGLAMMGFAEDVTRTATHYHTVAVDPIWNDSLIRTRHIGTHIFYRFPNWRERRAGVLQDRDA